MTVTNANRIQKPNVSQAVRQEDLLPSFNKLVEAIMPLIGQNQDKLETAVTFKDLQAGGFPLAFNNAGLPSIGGGVDSGDEELPNMAKPPAMSGVVFSATTSSIIMSWNPPVYANHSFVEIWRAPAKKEVDGVLVDTGLADAAYLASCITLVYADSVFPSESWRYFLRNVSQTGVKGDWHNNDGSVVSSADDPRYILDRIEGSILESDLSKDLGDKVGALDTMWTVKIDAGNAVAGIGLGISDEGQTEFIVRAHRFAVVPPQEFDVDGKPIVAEETIPFYVVEADGKWYTRIKNAVIDEAFIDSLVANGITAERVSALELTAVKITGGEFRGGDAGFGVGGPYNGFNTFIHSNGLLQTNNLQAINAHIKGRIEASTIDGGTITGATIIASTLYQSAVLYTTYGDNVSTNISYPSSLGGGLVVAREDVAVDLPKSTYYSDTVTPPIEFFAAGDVAVNTTNRARYRTIPDGVFSFELHRPRLGGSGFLGLYIQAVNLDGGVLDEKIIVQTDVQNQVGKTVTVAGVPFYISYIVSGAYGYSVQTVHLKSKRGLLGYGWTYSRSQSVRFRLRMAALHDGAAEVSGRASINNVLDPR